MLVLFAYMIGTSLFSTSQLDEVRFTCPIFFRDDRFSTNASLSPVFFFFFNFNRFMYIFSGLNQRTT